ELGEMVAQQLFLLAARVEELSRCGLARLRRAPVVPGLGQAGRPDRVVGKGVEDHAMVGRFEQPALLELALDLDQAVAQLAQQPHTRGLVVDKGAAAAVGREQPPQNDGLAGILAPGLAQDRVGGMVAPDRELGRHRRLLGPGPHQPGLRPPAERQAERVQEDRLAGPGLPGQHAQARAKRERESVDQHDIADGQAEQHCGDDTSAAAAKPAPSASVLLFLQGICRRFTSRTLAPVRQPRNNGPLCDATLAILGQGPVMTASKPELYRDLASELAALLAGEPDRIANAANMSGLIYHRLPDLNWAGFYFRQGAELVLGPFQGKPACVRVPTARGVCGSP